MTNSTMSEELLQQHIVKLLEAYARHDIEWHHVPNGAEMHPAIAKKMVLAGMKAGVADLMFMIGGRSFAVELKTEIGVVSKVQLAWRETFERAGGSYHVAFGMQEAIGVLQGIGAFRPNINLSLTTADDGRGVRRRPWEAKANRGANAPHLTPRPASYSDSSSPSEVRA